MFAEFTDQTAKVMSLANQEAQRLGHKSIEPEYILLVLLKEGSNKAVEILKHFDVDIEKLSAEIEAILEAAAPSEAGVDDSTQRPWPEKVMECAIRECKSLGADKLGTEHILLGLLSMPDRPAAQLLTRHGLNVDNVRQEIRT